MLLGEEHEEQLFLTKIFNIFILKLLITKILFYFKIKLNILNISLILPFTTCAFSVFDITAWTKTGSVFQDKN